MRTLFPTSPSSCRQTSRTLARKLLIVPTILLFIAAAFAEPPNFTVVSLAGSIHVVQDSQASTIVRTKVSSGFRNSIDLAVSGMPPGIVVSLSTGSIPSPGIGTAVMTVSASAGTRPGIYPITVEARSGEKVQQTTVSVTVGAAGLTPTGYGWHQLPNTVMSSVCRGNVANGMYSDPTMTTTTNYDFDCNQIIPWSGGIVDTVNNRVIVWGGGHTDYAGDEVSALNLNGTPAWTALTTPTYPVPYEWDGNNWEGLQPYFVRSVDGGIYQPGAKPASRHTYNSLAYVPSQNALFSFGGALANGGFLSQEVWSLNLSTASWTLVGPPYSQSPGFPTVAYNPNTGHILMHDKNWTLFDYNPANNVWTTLTTQYNVQDGTTAVVDPVNNLLVVVGAYGTTDNLGYPNVPTSNSIQVFPLTPPYAMQTWTNSSCDLIYHDGGLTWDSSLGLVVGYPGGGNQVYLLNTGSQPVTTPFGTVPSHQCLDVPISTNPAPVLGTDYPPNPEGTGNDQNLGIFGRFGYFPSLDQFAVVNDPTKNAWTVQLTGGGSAPNFAVSVPPTLSVPEGSQGTLTATTTVSNGFDNAIALTAVGMPAGVTITFAPSTIGAPGAGSSTMTVTVAASTQAGAYPIVVSASGGGDTHNPVFTLTVTSAGQPNFTLTPVPTSLNIPQGTEGGSTITTTISGGFNDPITLSASGAPAGATITFTPQAIPAPGSGSSAMDIMVASTTPTGTYPITVTGNGGGVQQNATVTLTVSASQGQPSFTLSAAPASLTVQQGNQGTSTITSTIANGFDGAVSLAASGVPSGTTVSFNPSALPAPGSGNATMSINVGASTAAGTYPIVVTGSGGGIQSNATVTLTVTGEPSFTLSAAPASLTIQQGNQGTSTITSTIQSGFNSAISLSASGAPSGATVSFNPASVPAPGSGNSTMTISVGASTPVGTYPITVTGNGGGVQQNTTVTLTVTSSGGGGGGGWQQGFDFRLTQQFVNDPPGDIAVLPTASYPTQGSGFTYGWVNTAVVSARNRNAGQDPRLAGVNLAFNGYPGTFKVGLPSSGTYNLSLAMGDAGFMACWVQCQIQFLDGSTVLATITKGEDQQNFFYDAQGNNWSAAAWPSGNVTQQVTLQGTVLSVVVGTNNLTGDDTPIAFLGIAQVSSGSPNFSLSASPSSLTVQQGNQGTSTITSTISGGFNGAIGLSASGVPSGTTVSFNPSTLAAPGSGTSAMTITVGASTPLGTYPITVTGNGGGLQRTTTVTLTVTAPPNFALSASPSSLTTAQGTQASSTITSAISGGFNAAISLSASGMPSGTTVSFNPVTIPAPGSGTSVLTITVGASTPVGTYPITVTGNGGGLQRSTTVTLTVTLAQQQPNFALSASPASLSIAQGSYANSTITSTISGGFNAAISLSASGMPSGTTVSFNPATIPAPGSGTSVLTITVGASTPTGTYPITVSGSGGGLQRTTSVTLTVTAAGNGWQHGFDFRNTASFVSDPAGDVGVLPTTAYPTNNNGVTYGWVNTHLVNGRDRIATQDPRLAGVNFAYNGMPATFNVALPSSGTYNLSLAMGDAGYLACWIGCQIQFMDGSTVLATIAKGLTQANFFYDMAGNNWSAANWPSDDLTQQVTLSGTLLTVVVGTTHATSDDTPIAFLGVAQVGGGSPNFSLSASPSSLTVRQGNQGSSTITSAISGGFNGAISLSASGMPSGTTVSFNPSTISAPGSGTSSMTITVGASTPVGTYPITVTGNGGGLQRTATVTLTVTAAANFALSASPSSLTVQQGNQGSSTITSTISGGFNSAISLSASGMPSGTTVSFNPATIPAPGSGTSSMTITVGASTTTGTYPITITGNGGGLQRTATVTLTVTAASSFALSASPSSLIVEQGNQGSSTITSTIAGGFNGAVSLAASGLPSGTTVSFNPQTLPAPGSGSSAMSISVGGSTPTGTYPITVTGTSGSTQETTTVTLTVTGSGGGGGANSITVQSTSGATQTNRPITIGRFFADGEIPPGQCAQPQINGSLLSSTQWQCDAKNHWPDGSLKFAILSFIVPSLPTTAITVSFVPAENGNNTGALTQAADAGRIVRLRRQDQPQGNNQPVDLRAHHAQRWCLVVLAARSSRDLGND